MTARRILLADDDLTNLAILKEVFSAEGFEVACASDGAEAVRLLEDKAFDLVVTDLNMPRVTGLEVARFARRQRPGRPVVVMSATWSPEQMREAKAVSDDTFEKPFDIEAVTALVHGLLDGDGGR